jgi:predicted exporter
VPTLFAARAVREADAYRQQALMRRRRRILVRDAVLAIIIALMVFGAWKVIALAFAPARQGPLFALRRADAAFRSIRSVTHESD